MTRESLDRPIATCLIALLVGAVFVVIRLGSYDWNATGFVHAGDRFVNPAQAPSDLIVRRNEVGFDGTGFYRFALNPSTRDRFEHGIELDIPAFRHQRILFPLIAWGLSAGGRSGAVGWALIAVNLAGFAGIGYVAGALAKHVGRDALWGLLLPFYPGFAVSLGLDTAEIVAAFFASCGILLLLRERFGLATLALVAAMFTRETTLLIAMGIGLSWVIARKTRRPEQDATPSFVFIVPAVAYGVWEIILRWWWGEWPLSGGSAVDVAAPFTGLVEAARGWPQTDGTQAAYQIILVAAMAAFITTVFIAARRSSPPYAILIAFGAGTLLAVLYSRAIWLHHWGFLRAFTETYLLGAIVILRSGVGLRRVTIASGALWVSIAINLALHP